MKYMTIIESKYSELNTLITFEQIERDTEIKWGADDKEPDGLKKWTVRSSEPQKEG